jgi:hypothetical protein
MLEFSFAYCNFLFIVIHMMKKAAPAMVLFFIDFFLVCLYIEKFSKIFETILFLELS